MEASGAVAWDTEGTKRRILDAARDEFARHGPAGTTVERIAKAAAVNKERVYNYFGGKSELFARVLQEQLATVAQDVPVDSSSSDGFAEYAGRLYDYHRQRPTLTRLLQWEALAFESEVPDEEARREYYKAKTAAFRDAQADGTIAATIDPDILCFLLISLAAYWASLPQVARMITSASATAADEEDARRRASVVEAARRLVGPSVRENR
jgi:AcrR family transcriptional regulator